MIEFLPESVDGDAEEELLSGPGGRLPRVLIGGVVLLAALVLAAALVALDKIGHDGPPPGIPTALPSSGATLPSLDVTAYRGLAHVRIGPTTERPVLAVATLGASTWVLQDDGLHVARPGRVPLFLASPGTPQTARLIADQASGLVWLVTQRRARAYSLPSGRVEFDGPVPAFSDVAEMDGRLYLAAGSELVEAGMGVVRPREIFAAPGPLAAVAADPTRHRLIVAYQSGPSRVFALQPRPHGNARVERSATIRTINATLAVAHGAIWFAGFSTGAGALMRLDPTTLRPAMHFAYQGSLGSGAVLVAEGTSSVWVREGLGGPDLRCVDARSGAQAQTWQLDGLISSADGRAVLGTGSGPLVLGLSGCPG